jgi:transposase
MPRLTEAQRLQVLQLRHTGSSMQEIARLIGCSPQTVSNTLRRHQQTGEVADRPRSGRPRASTEAVDRRIARAARVNPFLSASAIRQELSLTSSMSVRTVRRRLTDRGLFARVAQKKPMVSSRNRRKRIAFARTHEHWTDEQWSRVVFTDESKFNRLGSEWQAAR